MNSPIPIVEVDLYQSISNPEVRALIRDISQVVSESVLARFDALAQDEERVQWEKGDLTNEIYSAVVAARLTNQAGRPYQFLDVCYFVSRRFLRGARSHNTVKAWALTARRYPPSVRERFHYLDVPFSHFSYASRGRFEQPDPETGRPVWESILEYSWSLSLSQGYAASERQLREKFEPDTVPGATEPSRLFESGLDASALLGPMPVGVGSGDPEPVDYDREIRDALHNLQALSQALAREKPKRAAALLRALDLLWQALSVFD